MTPYEDQVSHIVGTLFRILRACNVSREVLIEAVEQSAAASEQMEAMPTVGAPASQHLACTDVVFSWRRSSAFLDERGEPRLIPLTGSGPTFESLCRLSAPSYKPEVLLDYLEALGAVERLVDGRIRLKAESVLTCRFGGGRRVAAQTVLPHLAGFLGAVEHNVTRPQDLSRGRFERACYSSIPISLVPVFERFVEVRGQNFVDTVDEWLVRHRASDDEAPEQTCLVGAGAYELIHSSNIFK